ncbi:signal peptide peptidase SppA, 67K type [Bernardetia litoralis DSM 6794]|uniref:Signal peptide peptidase SppA, 67K type n=1 Tax=Bernardetia litoralis (strain ATCC 23117 / DSM 6794 / NBRC 15988 / NCIMB 1366 / Fx l1 / Sio-4) TaxID=880071 RepID=I4AJN3_BERLS|nr:signal peptide peptidase SppA [Bernardetia litoralis]AFM04168.1 signal peptide peptidase SppA, 67K type [Bernardetia litoralis DSM 6794]
MSEPTDPLNTENTNPQRQAENQANRRKPQATRQNKANRPSLGQNILGFIKIAFATAFGIGIFICIMGFLFLIVGATSSSEIEIAEKSVLKISLGQSIVEYSKNDPVADLMAELQGGSTPLSLVNIKAALKKAKTDDNIKGIYLDVTDVPVGFAMLEEIHAALLDFKTSNKFIYAYSKYYGEKGYYLASTADEIYLYPQGALEMNGFFSQVPFFKKMLDKLEIEPRIYKVGTFKSAVEPFILEEMSDANREQTSVYLNSLYDTYLKNVAKTNTESGRKMTAEELREISNKMLIREAGDAITHKLINDTLYYDQVESKIKVALGILSMKENNDETTSNKKKISFVSLPKYIKTLSTEREGDTDKRIAIIVGEGSIVDGQGSQGEIGGDAIAAAIRKARKDKRVKAIVLRINSGGGSALASDIMWREVMLARKEKPIIASMSDVAASGGYYMAMACDTIVAHPNTITGSIGIFGILPGLDKFAENKIGITFDGVKTAEFADMGYPTRQSSAAEDSIIQMSVNRGYIDFTSKAAQGRKMQVEKLREYAEGRVWTGIDAKERGLVDVLGSLDDAIVIAANSAGLGEDYQVRYYPEPASLINQILNQGEQAKQRAIQEELGSFYKFYKYYNDLKTMQGIQARLILDAQNIE